MIKTKGLMNQKKEILVALAGNPNCGKTSLFNKLVGANQKVGNFSGVTVEKFTGQVIHRDFIITFVDLPGTYSLTSYSPEETVARDFLIYDKPDIVVNVVDSTNLERNFYLTTQLMDLKTNLIVALNMYDEVQAKNIKIDLEQLEKLLGAHLIPTSAVKNFGLDDLLDHIVDLFTHKIEAKKNKLNYSEPLENKITHLENIIKAEKDLTIRFDSRWLAIKLLVNDKNLYNIVREYPVWIKINKFLSETFAEFESLYGDDPEMLITEERYAFIKGALKETVKFPKKNKLTPTEIIDKLLINRITGLPVFIFFMWLIFQITFTLGEYPMTLIENLFNHIGDFLRDHTTSPLLESIVVDGIVAGVGGVLTFLPNILILFFSLSILEGTGYMARAAFVIDKVMHKFGLHGKSFIPMITGFGCSVPAFMATRTLKSESDRITTLLIIPFMSCGAKYPVYVLIIGAFFPASAAGNALFAVYLFGVLIALLYARIFKSLLFKSDSEPFVMELPPYRLPTLRSLIMQMWFKAWMYMRKAGTVILFVSVLIWIISNYPKDDNLTKDIEHKIAMVEKNSTISLSDRTTITDSLKNHLSTSQLEYSIAGRLGKIIEPVILPLGFDWRLGIALVTGLAAKEVVVSTMGTIYSLGDSDENSTSLREKLRTDSHYNIAVALSFLAFVLLYLPCIAATVVFHRESGSWKWTRLYIIYTMATAWVVAFIVYNVSSYFL